MALVVTHIAAPALVAWKEPIERRVLGAKDMRGVVIVSGVAYGDGGGGMLRGEARGEQAGQRARGSGDEEAREIGAVDGALDRGA